VSYLKTVSIFLILCCLHRVDQGAQPAAVRPRMSFDENVCGRAHVILNLSYGGRALMDSLSTA